MDKIRQPGKWLDEKLTQQESADFMAMLDKMLELKSQHDPEQIINALCPYMNSFMHLMYLLLRNKMNLEATDEGIKYKGKKDTYFDIVGYVTDFILNKYDINELINSAASDNQSAIINNQLAGFLTTHENRAFNELTKFTRSLPGENMTIDELLHQGTVSGEYVEMQTPLSKDNTTILSPWTVSTSQLFDRLIVEFTETGAKSRTITLSLDDYMQSRGLKDRKETRKQVKSDLHTLRTSAVSFKEYSGKGKKRQEIAFTDVNIAEAVGIDRNGKIMLTLTPSIYELLKQSYVMPLPQECQKINSKRNPNSYNLLRKIAEHKNMNIGKPNEDIISVDTLLKCCPAIPTYERVKKSDRMFTRRIIDPFCRDMDALETISWEFCNTNNEPLTDRQLAMSYDVFSKLNVHITWNVYPDQTARLEKKAAAQQKKAAARKKKSPNKKGVTDCTEGGNGLHKGG